MGAPNGVPPPEPSGGEHAPVLRNAAIDSLAIRADGCYVDATFGRGGHAGEILGRLGEEGSLVAIDRDPEAASAAAVLFSGDTRARFVRAPFSELLQHVGPASADGILFDLGVSSPQLDDARRGFSFMRDGPLDMRMDPDSGTSAAAFLATADEREIAAVIARLGEERHAKRIARAIVAARASGAIETTGRLAGIVAAAVPGREPGRHPATRTFQALRIHVNDELGELERALPQAVAALRRGGRLVVISFHSLEDRIAKRFMRSGSREDPVFAGLPQLPVSARPRLKLVGRATFADETEVAKNPRARSAVMRVAERLPA
ncbi:MAG TPA: 16S rRNA (cytosine(1402)-N(4))-methyltransferase RsmH [Steroidobacteraceae bacterium]|nr:16S rRNA (cytosine(1402)-N(4))-methyltransferase RsmH [Steroidobacteraceae bacterium]